MHEVFSNMLWAVLLRFAAAEGWQPQQRTLGIVGVGHVGSLIAEYGKLFGFRVLCCDPPRMRENPSLGFLSLEELLPQCDIVTLHVPIPKPDQTVQQEWPHRIFFAQMRSGADFINCSRGPVMQDEALLQALRSGKLNHIAIDTWNHEPNLDPELLQRALCATPPHCRLLDSGKAAGTAAVVQQLLDCTDGPSKHGIRTR